MGGWLYQQTIVRIIAIIGRAGQAHNRRLVPTVYDDVVGTMPALSASRNCIGSPCC